MECSGGCIGSKTPQGVRDLIMKILVLMPLDERQVYNCVGLWKAFVAAQGQKWTSDNLFFMPLYMDYLTTTGKSVNWMEAAGQAIISAKEMVSSSKSIIVFGNLPVDAATFDYIFNFQQNDQAIPYKDLVLEAICKTAQESNDDYLKQLFSNFYTADASIMALQIFTATAGFLSKWYTSEEQVDTVTERYKDKFKIFKEFLTTKYGKQRK